MFRKHLAALPAALLLTIACSTDTEPDTPHGPLTVEIRLLNGDAGAPSLDLLAGTTVIVDGVAYQHTSEFTTINVGARTLAVRKSGSTAVLRSLDTTLTPGQRYSIIASGGALTLSASSAALDTGQVKTDRANVRIVNVAVAPDSGNAGSPAPFDVHITAPGASLAGHQPQLSLDARYSSYSSLLYFDPGTWVVRFTRAGTTDVVAASASVAIGAGQVRAFMLEKGSDGVYRVTVVAE